MIEVVQRKIISACDDKGCGEAGNNVRNWLICMEGGQKVGCPKNLGTKVTRCKKWDVHQSARSRKLISIPW